MRLNFSFARIFPLVLLASVLAVAQTQVATVNSDSRFRLRGAYINPGGGVPSWPVLAGDEIKAGPTPVTLTFPDGSTVILAPDSTAIVNVDAQMPVFGLEDGAAHYSLKTLTSVRLKNRRTVVAATDLTGDLQTDKKKRSAGWWTPGHTGAVVGGSAAAAGLGVGIAKVSKGNQ